MARNVEIKARAIRPGDLVTLARSLSAAPPEMLQQTDIFFRTEKGRLKLRILAPDHGVLIFYDRPDQAGPKLSSYLVSTTVDPSSLRAVLGSAYGEEIVVRKHRTVIMLGRTRLHIDAVEGLGDFVELEVVLEDGEDVAAGVEEAHAIMKKLGIRQEELVEAAYADLLRQQAVASR